MNAAEALHGQCRSPNDRDSGDPLVVLSTGGVTQLIPASLVEKRDRMNRSLMLSADQLGYDAQAVADLVAYLRGL